MVHRKKNKKHIGNSLILGITLVVVILCLSLEVVGISIFKANMESRYEAYISDLLYFVMPEIDADDLEQCIITKKPSPKYNELQILLNKIKESHSIDYIYIIKPLFIEGTNNMMDVMAGVTQEERIREAHRLTYLGKLTGNTYPPEIAELYMSGMNRRQRVTFFRDNIKSFNDDYTGIMPILNSDREPIALLCVDVAIGDMKSTITDYAFLSLIVMVLMAGSLLILTIHWLKNHIINPLCQMEKTLNSFVSQSHGTKLPKALVLKKPDIHTGDEIESLADSIVLMSEDMKTYMESMLESSGKIANLQHQMEHMDEYSFKDELTHVKNKLAFDKSKKNLDWDIANHNGDLALLLVGINGLIQINENYGTECSNIYVKSLSKLVCSTFHHSPVYRITPENFLVVVKSEDLHDSQHLVEKLKAEIHSLSQNQTLQPWERVSAAVGVVYYDEKLDQSINDLLKRVYIELEENRKS